MGSASYPNWLGTIHPFYDRPDIGIQVLFYAVPEKNPSGPATVFTDRFWDQKDGWVNLGVGTVVGSLKPYFGPVPNRLPGVPEGRPEWWTDGMDYSVYLNGGYSVTEPCWDASDPGAFDDGFSSGFEIGY